MRSENRKIHRLSFLAYWYGVHVSIDSALLLYGRGYQAGLVPVNKNNMAGQSDSIILRDDSRLIPGLTIVRPLITMLS